MGGKLTLGLSPLLGSRLGYVGRSLPFGAKRQQLGGFPPVSMRLAESRPSSRLPIKELRCESAARALMEMS